MNIENCNDYYFHLFNGQCWRLTASDDTMLWLKKLASIMSFDTASNNYCSKLSFIQCNMDTDYHAFIPYDLPEKGWLVRRLKYVRLLYHNELPNIICNIGTKLNRDMEYMSMNCSLTPIVEQVIKTGGAPFHSGLIVRDGYGVLLMATSKVGKSTCCRRLPPPWKAWCDDITLLIKEKNTGYHAHPLPTWGDLADGNQDITWNVQAHIPIKAIFLLEQSERDKAMPIGRAQAALSIYHSALRGCYSIIREEACDVSTNNRYLTFNNICDITKMIPAFRLCTSLDGKFWEEIEKVLQTI